MKKILCIAVCVLAMLSCRRGVVVSEYQSLPLSGWSVDSVLCFSFSVPDQQMPYDMELNVRHTDDYPYQNIWVFTSLYADSLLVSTDTLSCFLANQRGEWLGRGAGRLREVAMPYLQNQPLDTCHYRLEVRHGMREEVLYGVNDFGFTVIKSNR